MSRMKIGVLSLAAAALIGAAGFATPARADDRSVCFDQNASHGDAITACGRLIDAGKAKGNDLAGIYRWRSFHFLSTNNVDKALPDLDNAIRLFPKFAVAYSTRCWAWHDKGDADKAVADCNQALQIDPKMWSAYINRGNAYILKKDYDNAVASYDQAIGLQPTNAQGFERRGDAFIAKNDPDRAIIDFNEAIRLEPKRTGSFNRRGNAYFTKKMWDLAIADYTTAIQIDPTQAQFVRNRGWTLLQKGDNEHALADLTEAVRLSPNADNFINDLGQVFLSTASYDRAIAKFDDAIRINAKNNAALGNRGLAYFFKGDFDHALADYAESLRLNPQNASVYNNRCLLLSRKGDLDAAMTDCDQALRLAPKSATAFGNRCGTRLAKDDLDAAVIDCDQAVALDPGYTGAYVNRGLVFERKGDRARAAADFQTALTKPAKYLTGKTFQDTARQHLAALGPAAETPTPVAPPPVAQQGGRRVALVIGNSAYKAVAALPNPSRDAGAVAGVLRRAGFQTVTLETDLSLDRMVNALRLFARQAESADWALIYYAGHGMEMNGINYLVPVDAKLETDRDVNFEAVPLDQVMNAVEGARKLRVVILDACRDNPFANQMRRTTASRSIGRGLARVEPDGGTLVAYAAKGGEVALDGDGQNSPFVTAILKYLPMPNVEINKFFRLVRDDVLTATGRKQEPFVYGSLPSEDFFFVAK